MSTRRDLDDALRAWGDEPGPAPDPAFLARLEHRLRHDDGAVEVEVDLQPAGRAVPLRRRVGVVGVAAVAMAAVATAAAALGTFAPEPGVRVDPGADPTEATLPVGPSTSTPTVTVSSSTTTVVVDPATTAAAATMDPTTTAVVEPTSAPATVPAAEVTTTPTTSPTEPATTRATVAPPTAPPVTEPPTTAPPTTEPPATTVPPPTTEVHPVTTFSVTCAYAVVDTRPAIVCEWSEPPGGAASYRILKGDQQASVGRVLSPTPGTRRYVDRDIVSGHTYSYLLHALDAGGTKTGQSNLVAVACCTA